MTGGAERPFVAKGGGRHVVHEEGERIDGERLRLRPVVADDVPALRGFLADPSVARWWPMPPDERWPYDEDDVVPWTIEVDGDVAGLVQYGEESDPDYRHASIDIFLGPSFHGRGLGPEAVATLARYLIDVRGHHRITIDPAVENERAVAGYAKVGFRPVGVMRRYERDAVSGEWHDNLLMDLLADDLR